MISRTRTCITFVLLVPAVIFYVAMIVMSIQDCSDCYDNQCCVCGILIAVFVTLFIYYGLLLFMNVISLAEIIDVRAGKIYKGGKHARYLWCSYMFMIAMLTPVVLICIIMVIYSLVLPYILGFTVTGNIIVVSLILATYHIVIMVLAIKGIIDIQKEKRNIVVKLSTALTTVY
jgi:hypothetical protein